MSVLSEIYKEPGSVTHFFEGNFIENKEACFVLIRGSILLEFYVYDSP